MLQTIKMQNGMHPQMTTAQPYTLTTDTETQTLCSMVVNLVSPAAVFLLGKTVTQRETTGLFAATAAGVAYTSHCYLLLLTEAADDHTIAGLHDKLENNPSLPIPVTAIILNTAIFLSWAAEGHPFAATVLGKAELLYKTNTLHLPCPATGDEAKTKTENETLYSQTKSKVESFLAGAELYKVRKEYKLAAFMLHQAAEQALRTILIIQTGYRANTHSIDRLLRYCAMCSPRLLDLFSKTESSSFPLGAKAGVGGQKLFTLLQKAYIHARYNNDYTVTYDELTALTKKVHLIKQLLHNHKP